MDPLKVRIRDGCRGGQELFKWNSIKEQEFKDRECYLGASMKVGMMTKFARYYVHDWYAKKRDVVDGIDNERKSVQAYEEELMQEALGMKPKKLLLSKRQLTEDEMKDLLRREGEGGSDKKGREALGPQKKIMTDEHGEQFATSNEEYVAIAARDAPVKGIGFASHRTAKLEEIKAQALGTEGSLEGTALVKLEQVKLEQVKEEQVGGSSSSSGARIKEEDGRVKEELQHGLKREADGEVKLKKEKKEKVKKEKGDKEKKKDKKEKKRKKAEKKLRKAEKKLQKATREAARRSGKRVEASPTPERPRGGWRDSDNSSSSSSS